MDQHALVLVHGVLNEVVNLVGGLVGAVEQYLVLFIEPGVGQVLHPDVRPLVLNLPTAAVYHPGDLVRHHKLQVLGCKRVPNKQAVLYLYGPNHVVVHHFCSN